MAFLNIDHLACPIINVCDVCSAKVDKLEHINVIVHVLWSTEIAVDIVL
jgi:hypothetical protein